MVKAEAGWQTKRDRGVTPATSQHRHRENDTNIDISIEEQNRNEGNCVLWREDFVKDMFKANTDYGTENWRDYARTDNNDAILIDTNPNTNTWKRSDVIHQLINRKAISGETHFCAAIWAQKW